MLLHRVPTADRATIERFSQQKPPENAHCTILFETS
jgi:hypothetical protein